MHAFPMYFDVIITYSFTTARSPGEKIAHCADEFSSDALGEMFSIIFV